MYLFLTSCVVPKDPTSERAPSLSPAGVDPLLLKVGYITISIHQTSEQRFSRALIGYSISEYPLLFTSELRFVLVSKATFLLKQGR